MCTHGFTLEREVRIGEIDTLARVYRHHSGALLISAINTDENKVFGVNFRTPPPDSTGIAHILEHAVLCGSRKYPVKEPFVELLKGSLKTFLNAFTYPDRTCYPVASQNTQDFYNLIDVYLDAVFHPRLTPQVLEQEGWHYELTSPTGPLSYKGVVFNEMKGAYSSPDSVLYKHVQESLFPDTPYGLDSGGNPRHIPALTFAQFSGFHRRHYHPANAFLFFAGDDDPERRLLLLEEYLAPFEGGAEPAAIPPQPSFAEPRSLRRPYAAGQEHEGKSMVALNWLLPDGLDLETEMGLQILTQTLIGTPASPLRKALIDSGLGEDLIGGGMEGELRQLFFSTGLKGVAVGREEEVQALVIRVLGELAAEGIAAGEVAAALNTVEFGLRENNTGSYPRGLILMLRSLTAWTYGRDPLAPLAFSSPLEAVRARAGREGDYFGGLIRRYLLDNPHRTTVVLHPDLGLAGREEAEEQERLAQVFAGLGAQDRERLIEENEALRQRQEAPDPPEALAALPRLGLADLEPKVKTLPLEQMAEGGTSLLYHELSTNGIVYLDLAFDLRALPQELLPYVPLFGRALLETGTAKGDFVDLARRIGARTGGIWPQLLIVPPRGRREAVARFVLRGKVMADRADQLLDLLREVLLEARIDDQHRLLQMAREEKAAEEAGLVPGGHGVVGLRLRAQYDEAAWALEQMEGISYLFFLRRLAGQIESDWPAVRDRLLEIRRRLLHRGGLLANITLSGADRARFHRGVVGLLAQLPAGEPAAGAWRPAFRTASEGLIIPAKVNYVGKAARLYDWGYQYEGSAGVVSRYLRNTWLWDRVRVQGGAYGAFCSFDPFSGVFAYGSYRDPNLRRTLEVYDRAGQFLRQIELGRDEVERAIIGAIGEQDAHQLPDAKGYTSMVRYLTGVDDGFRQQIRDAVLGTGQERFAGFAEALEKVREHGRVVVMGAREALEGSGPQGWLELTEVM
ncbi:MAG: insulinase family protein [Candidatus Handelsmanbacteria bacterium]|nr:insulinase family protein [Candidatus Handelsmanbacteria bacterium]